jgi:hypothetical protein
MKKIFFCISLSASATQAMQTAKVYDQQSNPLAKQEKHQKSICLQTKRGCCWMFAALKQCFGCCRHTKPTRTDNSVVLREKGHSSTHTTQISAQAKELWIENMGDIQTLQTPEALSPAQILGNKDPMPQVEQSPGITEEPDDYELVETEKE